MTAQPVLERDFDILEMPVNGLAAYWLSVKKLRDTRKGAKIVQEEIAHIKEPFIKHLLEIAFSSMDAPMVRALAEAKRRVVLRELRRRHDLMRIAVLAIADNENPRVTLIKMNALFPVSPVRSAETMQTARAMIDRIKNKEVDGFVFGNVDHTLKNEQLILKLLYYVQLARREDRNACRAHIPHINSRYFADGLALLCDNFDEGFIRRKLEIQQRELLLETAMKMSMAIRMCLGIKQKLAYNDVFNIAKSYMAET